MWKCFGKKSTIIGGFNKQILSSGEFIMERGKSGDEMIMI